MSKLLKIGVVVPLFNEQDSLNPLAQEIVQVMQINNYDYEIWFIDDGSTDLSWQVIEQLHTQNPKIHGVRFRRNYGKSAALNVGFQKVNADIVITMDADLQDDPHEIPELANLILSGYELVSGWKLNRAKHDPITKSVPTKLFNWATRKMSGIPLHDFNCGLKAYHIDVVKTIEVYGEMHRYIPVIAKWAGFTKITEKRVNLRPRLYGKSKFGWNRFINGLLDLLSITFTSKYMKKPMHFFGTIGIIFMLLGTVSGTYLTVMKYAYNEPLKNRMPLLFLTILLVISGIQFFMTGFVGDMISRTNSQKDSYNIKTIL
ncbi:MAG: glycosyltransferase family 2 protein [Bacteroidia bacterium]|nr:glycosyltransferase family 2 protein [Bacteroidia bacterium]MDW8346346.1 glycosyltransferase family 2 protein [Bacteroidia bacterium]